MSIVYSPERGGWELKDPTTEEKDALIEIGISVIITRLSHQFMEQKATREDIHNALDNMSKRDAPDEEDLTEEALEEAVKDIKKVLH